MSTAEATNLMLLIKDYAWLALLLPIVWFLQRTRTIPYSRQDHPRSCPDLDDAEPLYQQAAERDDVDALLEHAQLQQRRGDRFGAEIVAWQAAEHGRTDALPVLAVLHEQAGKWDKADALYRVGIDRGHLGLRFLVLLREQVGDHDGAERVRRFGLTDDGTPSRPAQFGSNDLFRRRATPPVTTAGSGSVHSGGRGDD